MPLDRDSVIGIVSAGNLNIWSNRQIIGGLVHSRDEAKGIVPDMPVVVLFRRGPVSDDVSHAQKTIVQNIGTQSSTPVAASRQQTGISTVGGVISIGVR